MKLNDDQAAELDLRCKELADFMYTLGAKMSLVPVEDLRRFMWAWERLQDFPFHGEKFPSDLFYMLDDFKAGLQRLSKGLPWVLKPVFEQTELGE